jgi:sialate O-acetylesterase
MCLAVFAAVVMKAQPRLSALFSDNMVLQQKSDVPIWGKSEFGKKIIVTSSWNGEKLTVRTDKTGNWKVLLHTPKAGGPYEIAVSDGKQVVLHNVMIGEVWLCSGQSNMEFPVRGWAQVLNADKEVSQADYPGIRLLQIHKVVAENPSSEVVANTSTWQMCTPQSIPDFSAVAYFFARELNRTLDVPVGVIDATWGGSNIESWISKESLEQLPQFADSLKRVGYGPWRNSPTALYNGMINPVIPMAIRGVCWYQGEQNELRGYEYRDLFPLLIQDWRRLWHTDFPFYYVQLANYHDRKIKPTESLWAEVREAQSMALHLEGTGMVVAMDVGQGGNVHYPNKQEVAHRLALIALARTYGKKIEYSGPKFKNYSINRGKIILSFDKPIISHTGKFCSLTIAGVDHKFYNADAVADGCKVIVSADSVITPIAVRYAWQDNPDADLFGINGLPVAPFRTDDWQGLSFGKTRLNSAY